MTKGRFSDSASERAVTYVNAEQAPKTGFAGADPPPLKGKATAAANRGMTGGPTMPPSPRRSCRGKGDGTTQEEVNATREIPVGDSAVSTGGPRGMRLAGREVGKARSTVEAANHGGGKGPWFKDECRKWGQPGDW